VKEDKLAVIWQLFGMAILAAAATMLVAFILSPKKVDGYYLSRGQNSTGNVCVYAHWTWHTDELAFCTDRYADALEFATKANASMK
jgi:hypothetical protein